MHHTNSIKENEQKKPCDSEPVRPEIQHLGHAGVLLTLSHISCVQTVDFGSSEPKSSFS